MPQLRGFFMYNIIEDVNNTLRLINIYIVNDIGNYGKLYINTNEPIRDVLSICDFNNKKVLTVLASSDQLLAISELNPLKIDTFDINILTMYFFYLKKWFFLMYHELISYGLDKKVIFDCLKIADLNNNGDKNAYIYWSILLDKISIEQFYDLFYLAYEHFDIINFNKTEQFYKNYNLNFRLMDLFSNSDFSEKYDVIVLSNILESLTHGTRIAYILNNMLLPHGEVICSNVATFNINENHLYERSQMEELFEYCDGIWKYDPYLDEDVQIAYKYVKR